MTHLSASDSEANSTEALWRSSAPIEILQLRAKTLSAIRSYFQQLRVMEVETPLLSHQTITDPHIHPITAQARCTQPQQRSLYLQTSPEFHMKRLLASGSGSIYQISKAFRDDEVGCYHNPEFTLLEWYRVGVSYKALIEEMTMLLQQVGITAPAQVTSYKSLFTDRLGIDPHCASTCTLKQAAQQAIGSIEHLPLQQPSDWLDLLFSHCIQPSLGLSAPLFVYGFPACQSALAQIDPHDHTAQRFELFYKGLELANGYQELTDPAELQKRLNQEHEANPERALDHHLVNAQIHGIPECSGVALGVDRLLMSLHDCSHIKECIAFDFARA